MADGGMLCKIIAVVSKGIIELGNGAVSTYSQVETSIVGWTIRVRGTVQGVGFRPTVFKLANRLGITGSVLNDGDGVLIEAFAPKSSLAAFVQAIRENAPPLACIEEITHREFVYSELLDLPPLPTSFAIQTSETSESDTVATNIAADAATCAACIADIFSPSNRRFRYPFTNCTHCGPRLSIIKAIPYDRATTSMAVFPMCTDCQREYDDPEDRRFHAQPNACSLCGPRVWLEDKNGLEINSESIDAIDAAANLIKLGQIVAIKGIGGFHLACDGSNEKAVATLRERKQRFDKPFALMARELDIIKNYCLVSRAEEALLASHEAPIVLLDQLKLEESEKLAPSVAPGQATLGLMLPYTALHHLLLENLDRPIVLTSGNRSEEPQCTDNDEAKARLSKIADFFLLHDRVIVNRLDDSVVCVVDEISASVDISDISRQIKFEVLRRARGYAPSPIKLPPGFAKAPEILALGAELKNTFCLLQNNCAIVSQHMGDLEEANTYCDYQKSLELYQNCFQFKAKVIAIDFHPEYLSSKLGEKLAREIESKSEAKAEAEINTSTDIEKVQHHHAHIASCLADNGWPREAGPVLGVALDGLGYGLDDSYWGGEFLLADYGSFERLATFKPVAMLGGAQAMREPWRNAYAHIVAAMGWQNYIEQFAELELTKYFLSKPLATFNSMLETKRNAPYASSAGRLFDAVAAAIGICCSEVSYEGQAAIELEALVNSKNLASQINHGYSFAIANLETGMPYIEPKTMWQALLNDLRIGIAAEVMSARFHLGLAKIIVAMVEQLCTSTKNAELDQEKLIATVALSGGVFQNRTLLQLVSSGLAKNGYTVLSHQQVPTNEGGISLGQAVVSAARRIEKKERSHVSWHTWASR